MNTQLLTIIILEYSLTTLELETFEFKIICFDQKHKLAYIIQSTYTHIKLNVSTAL